MNTPAQCGAIKPPKTDIYSEAPRDHGWHPDMREDSGVPADSSEEQSPLDKALRRLKSDLTARNGRIILAVVAVALIALVAGLVHACGGDYDRAESRNKTTRE